VSWVDLENVEESAFYVLSGKRPISAPTRPRVERSIRRLTFRPHASARAGVRSRAGAAPPHDHDVCSRRDHV